jgi:uncharacterized protein (AIM24 family)
MAKLSLGEFIANTHYQDNGETFVALAEERLLAVRLDGGIWTKAGAMVAYRGNIRFVREGILEHGISRLFKETFTSEGLRLMKAEGVGILYLADSGKKITILDLQGETLFVKGNDVLAFELGLQWDITWMKKIASMLAGGLFNVKFKGKGLVAISTHHEGVTLPVHPGQPLVTDPNATVAWSGSLSPTLQTDISLKTFLGRGSGESLQMRFEGEGWVIVQPYEEMYTQI